MGLIGFEWVSLKLERETRSKLMPSSLATPDWHSSPLDPVEHRRQQQQQQQQQRRHRRLQQQQQQQQQQPQRRDDYFRFDDSTVVK